MTTKLACGCDGSGIKLVDTETPHCYRIERCSIHYHYSKRALRRQRLTNFVATSVLWLLTGAAAYCLYRLIVGVAS